MLFFKLPLKYKKSLLTLILTCGLGIFLAVACGRGSGSDEIVKELPGVLLEKNRILNRIRDNGTPVGLSTFAMGVRGKFPLEDTQQIQGIGYKVVARSVRVIATNELYTFPEQPDHDQIKETIKFFIDSGHDVVHQIFILNGPGIKAGSDRVINSFVGREVKHNEYRDLLFNSSYFRDRVLNLFSEVVTHARALEAIGAEVFISPELEDAHSDGESGSFGILLDLLKASGWTNHDGNLRREYVVRNGGSVGKIRGIRYEVHTRDINKLKEKGLRPGDFVNTDGQSFSFNSDKDKPGYLFTENEIRELLDYCEENGLIFFIWSDRLQGLRQVAKEGFVPFHDLNNRIYELKNPVDLISILLRVRAEEVRLN